MTNLAEKISLELIGKEFETNNHGKCFVVDYKNARNVTVMFYDPLYITKCKLGSLRRGSVANPMQRNVFGKGYIGVGQYSSTKNRRVYVMWFNMLRRAYDYNTQTKFPTYSSADICEDWLNFQNFAEWCYGKEGFDYYDESGRVFQLDKDIIFKGNKTYCPESCCFVPLEINFLFTSRINHRGEQPVGVYKCKKTLRFKSSISIAGKRKSLGTFNTEEEAFNAYKEAKESHIKELANKWRFNLTSETYNAMMSYQVSTYD